MKEEEAGDQEQREEKVMDKKVEKSIKNKEEEQEKPLEEEEMCGIKKQEEESESAETQLEEDEVETHHTSLLSYSDNHRRPYVDLEIQVPGSRSR